MRAGLQPGSPDHERGIRRGEQHPEPVAPACDAAGHLERGGDAVGRDEPERPCRPGIAAACDEHAARALEDGRARRPVDVGQQRMRGAAPAVGVERARRRRPPAAARRRAAPAVAPSRSTWKRLRYGACGPCPNVRRRSCRRTTVPPSRSGEASRQSRSAWPRPIAAAVIGFSGSRGSCSDFHGSGTTIVSSWPSSGAPRSEIPRRSASACETAGGPARTATALSSRPRRWSARSRSVPGSAFRSRRIGERASAAIACGEEG